MDPHESTIYQSLVRAINTRNPHAILLFGNWELVVQSQELLIKYLLCTNPSDGYACNICDSCILYNNNTHPDILVLLAENDSNKKSNFIKMEQLKPLNEFAFHSKQIGRYKVVSIPNATQLSLNTANALLKLLEEPPTQLKFILAAPVQETLLPTILSRCFKFEITSSDSNNLLLNNLTENDKFWNGFFDNNGTIPIQLLTEDELALIINGLSKPTIDNIFSITAKCDFKKIGFGFFLDLLLKWLNDLIFVSKGNNPQYFQNYHSNLASLSSRIDLNKLFILHDRVIMIIPWKDHSLNIKLQIENLLFQYQISFQ